jgi:hypothetical protein
VLGVQFSITFENSEKMNLVAETKFSRLRFRNIIVVILGIKVSLFTVCGLSAELLNAEAAGTRS